MDFKKTLRTTVAVTQPSFLKKTTKVYISTSFKAILELSILELKVKIVTLCFSYKFFTIFV